MRFCDDQMQAGCDLVLVVLRFEASWLGVRMVWNTLAAVSERFGKTVSVYIRCIYDVLRWYIWCMEGLSNKYIYA